MGVILSAFLLPKMAFWGDLGSFEGSDGKIVRSDCKNGSWVAKMPFRGVRWGLGASHTSAPNRHPGARNALRQPSQTQPRGERVLRLAGTANSCSKNEKPSFGSPHRDIKSTKEGQTRPFRVSSSSARQRYEENSRNRQKSPKK